MVRFTPRSAPWSHRAFNFVRGAYRFARDPRAQSFARNFGKAMFAGSAGQGSSKRSRSGPPSSPRVTPKKIKQNVGITRSSSDGPSGERNNISHQVRKSSSGRFGRRRRSRNNRKLRNNNKPSSFYLKGGVGASVERSYLISETGATTHNSLYFGHSTWDVDSLANQLSSAIVKKLFNLRGEPVNNLALEHGIQGIANPAMDLRILYNVQGGTAPQIKIVTVGLTDNYGLIGFNLRVGLIAIYNDFPDTTIISFSLQDNASVYNPVLINVIDASVDYYLKSEMKYQNRTGGVATGDGPLTDVVDQAPLCGMTYSGIGNGCQVKWPASYTTGSANNFQSNNEGIFSSAAIDPSDEISGALTIPPVSKATFARVVKLEKIKNFAPGGILKNTLVYHGKKKMNEMLLETFRDSFSPSTLKSKAAVGKFSFVGLEHEINVDRSPINIAVEYVHTVCCSLSIKKKWFTVMSNTVA